MNEHLKVYLVDIFPGDTLTIESKVSADEFEVESLESVRYGYETGTLIAGSRRRALRGESHFFLEVALITRDNNCAVIVRVLHQLLVGCASFKS